jgi:hypothetical protein
MRRQVAPHSRVVYSVQRLENRLPMLDGHERAEHPCRNVPEQRLVADRLGGDLQRGGVHHLRHLQAVSLRSGHFRRVHRLCIGDGGQDGPFCSRQSSVVRPGEGRWLGGGGCPVAVGGRLKASDTTFSWHGVCLMSDVNSAMKESCRCWQADPPVRT